MWMDDYITYTYAKPKQQWNSMVYYSELPRPLSCQYHVCMGITWSESQRLWPSVQRFWHQNWRYSQSIRRWVLSAIKCFENSSWQPVILGSNFFSLQAKGSSGVCVRWLFARERIYSERQIWYVNALSYTTFFATRSCLYKKGYNFVMHNHHLTN